MFKASGDYKIEEATHFWILFANSYKIFKYLQDKTDNDIIML